MPRSTSQSAIDTATVEAAIRRIGQDLTQRSAGLTPTVFDSRWWANSLLDWCMKDEHFKLQLFRFIDVLPALKSEEQVARLITEYFGDSPSLAKPLQWGLRAVTATRLGARLSAKSLRHQIHQMASVFIAGATVEEALPTLGRMWREGRGFSVDLLGEATLSETEADQYRDRCLQALEVLGAAARIWPHAPVLERDHLGVVPRVQLSVKLSALYSQLDAIHPDASYQAVAARLRPILDQAMVLPAAITFDMEQAELKDMTLMIFERLLSEEPYRDFAYAGVALQAYLKRSDEDLNRLILWARGRGSPITIRLVKGAYWDSDTIRHQQRGWPVPVFESKHETDSRYEALSRVLIQHADLIRPAFGTHNLRSLAHAEAFAQAAGLPPDACEFQMIFGMAEPLQHAVAAGGRRVRIYTPIGEILPGMAYLVRRLLENTSNESFLRREYAEDEPLDRLLAAPLSTPFPTNGEVVQGNGQKQIKMMKEFQNEPYLDFSRPETHAQTIQALAKVRKVLGKRLVLQEPQQRNGPELVSVNPSDPSEVVGRVTSATVQDVEAAVRTVEACREHWRMVPAGKRADVLRACAKLMRNRRFELIAWEILEVGKPWREADADVAEAIDFLEYYAAEMSRLAPARRLGTEPGEVNECVYAPRGIAAVIAPWNFPLAIPTGMVSAALVTGNGVLFKPSERASAMGHWLVQLLYEAGLPTGVLQYLPGGPEIGQALASRPEVHVIAFTGSKEVGLRLLAESALVKPGQHHVKRVIAEMGGKNAIIVDDTADLDEAVTGVIASFTSFQGQKCSACSRAIVLEPVYDVFLQRLTEAVQSLPIGPPEDPTNRIGPMIDERAVKKAGQYLEIGRREGRLVIARTVEDQPGFFFGPAVFAEIEPRHRLAQEEIFAPVLAVMRAREFDEALAIANSTSYALTGGLYSRSPTNIDRARQEFDVGNLYINRPITGALVARQPFGGYRLSGVGAKSGGSEYLTQFMVTRVISENTIRRGFAPSG
jgi:RHH-type transcriptional regulator, proline utilization regulon repressor / proline dehydrogenase / delta 1-pyrroline-5-carboxylate dehydrogenase